MAFRIGSIEFGVSANVSQALRGIQQVNRELGTLERVAARVQRGISSSDRKQILLNQLEIIKAERQRVGLGDKALRQKQAELQAQLTLINAEERRNALLTQQQAIAKSLRDTFATVAISFATGGLVSFIQESTILAARVENLGTILRNVGSIAGFNEAQLASLEDRVKSLGITTQAARESLSILALNEQDLGQAATLARIAQDAAAIAAINSSQAFEKLTVAIQRLDTRMLRQLGIVVNLRQVYARYALETGKSAETLTAVEKQQLLLNEVLKRGANIAGTYEASLQDSFKQLTSLDRLTEEFRRELGENFLPVFEDVVKAMTQGTLAATRFAKENGALSAGLAALVVTGGAAIIATRGLALAFTLLGFNLKGASIGLLRFTNSVGVGTTAVAGFARALGFLTSPLGLGLLVLGVSSAVAAYVSYSAAVRNATEAERERERTIRKNAQEFADIRDAAQVVQELGGFTEKTTEQQVEFNNAVDKIVGLLPSYSARLRAVSGDAKAFIGVLGSINQLFVKSQEEIEREFERRRQSVLASTRSLIGEARRDTGTTFQRIGGREFFKDNTRPGSVFEGTGREGRAKLASPIVEQTEVLAAAIKDTELSADAAAAAIANLFDVPSVSVLSKAIETLRQLNLEQDQIVVQARKTADLLRLDNIFAQQQVAADTTLRLQRDAENERLKLIKDTNIEVAKDYVDLAKVLQTQFLTTAEIQQRIALRTEQETTRITRNFQKEIESARLNVKESEPNTKAQRDAQKALDDLISKRDAAISEAKNLAEEEGSLATRQLKDRAKLEADAEAFIAQRVTAQEKEANLIERTTRLIQLEAEGTKQILDSQEKLLDIQEKRKVFEESLSRITSEIGFRKETLKTQKGKEEEVAKLEAQLSRLAQIGNAQLRVFEAQSAQIRADVERASNEAKREVDEFIQVTQEKLLVKFRNGRLVDIGKPFQEVAKRVAEFRQEFKGTVDSYIEQLKRARSAEQVNQLGTLFDKQVKNARRDRLKNIQSLDRQRRELFITEDPEFAASQGQIARDLLSQGFSQQEVDNRLQLERNAREKKLFERDEQLKKEIQDARNADAEQRKIEDAEKLRFQQQVANRTEALTLEALTTGNMAAQAQLATTISNEFERRLQASKELLALQQAMTVSSGGVPVSANTPALPLLPGNNAAAAALAAATRPSTSGLGATNPLQGLDPSLLKATLGAQTNLYAEAQLTIREITETLPEVIRELTQLKNQFRVDRERFQSVKTALGGVAK